MSLSERMIWLAKRGCHPCVARRGNLWRAHVNGAGNWWADARTPHMALETATKAWLTAGSPVDGYADNKGGAA